MKKTAGIIFFFMGAIIALRAQKPAYSIKITLKDYKQSEIYLGYSFADKKYLADTAKFQKGGFYVFEGSKPLTGGVYFLYTPTKLYYEFLVDDVQHFSIESDTVQFVQNAKVKDSPLNTVFFSFVSKAGPIQVKMGDLAKKAEKLNAQKDSIELAGIRKQTEELNKEIKALQDQVIRQNPDLFFTKLLLGMRDPEISENMFKKNDGSRDFQAEALYYKSHFWDTFDFLENKLAFSEVFHGKLKTYMSRLVFPQPDSMINEAKILFEKSEKSPDLTKYLTHFLYVFGDTSRIMGAENLAVFVGKNYYTKEKAAWADTSTLRKIKDHVTSLEPLTIGKRSPNVRLADTSGKNFPALHNVNAKFTVLVFWDPSCGHCKKDLPKLQKFYDEWKSRGVEIFAVCTQREVEDWKKFIREEKLTFIHVAVWPEMAKSPEKYIYEMGVTDIESLNIHRTFYISSTPQIYLLDKDKKILGRRLSPEALPRLLEAFEKNAQEKK
jgi:peroxiredoxin